MPNAWSSSILILQAVAIQRDRLLVLVNWSSICSRRDKGSVMLMALVGLDDRFRLILGPLLFLQSGLQTSNTTLETNFFLVFGRACHNLAEDEIPLEGIVDQGESFNHRESCAFLKLITPFERIFKGIQRFSVCLGIISLNPI